ncbi:MAG: MATE family efflux transporter [Candidatus Merdivicinus sp.]|jgi:putative MATE family efflux protein
MEQKQNRMGTAKELPLLLSMGVPMMISMLIQSLYNIVDSMFVAKLGTDAFTAVSLAFPLQNIVISVAVGVGVGISTAISISLGAGDQQKANRAATVGVTLTVLHCILFVIMGLLVTRPFLQMFTSDLEILEQACNYTYIVLCFSSGSLLQICLEKIFQAVGSMKITMVLLMLGCILNIILDPILIFGLFGMPAMGVSGAAAATVIGQSVPVFFYFALIIRRNIGVRLDRRYILPDKETVKRIYSVGVPSTLMLAIPSVLVSFLNGILAQISQVYVAVLGIYFKLQTFIYMPASGLVQGLRPIVGYNYGAGEYQRVRRTVSYALLLALAMMAIGTVAAFCFPAQILSLFDEDGQMIRYGVPALRLISLGFLVSAVGVVYSGTFEGLGMGKQSLIISLLRQFVIILPLGWVLSIPFGAAGIWISFPVAELVAAVVSVILLRRTHNGQLSPGFRLGNRGI